MKFAKFNLVIVLSVIAFAGCYTQLMTPQQYVQYRKQAVTESGALTADATTPLNYNRDCLSCHSKYELEDRYQELVSNGLMTVHGYALDRSLWDSPYAIEYYTPDPYGWRRPVYSNPWWIPPAAAISSTSSSATSTSERSRTTGNTRDGNTRSDRTEPLPAYIPSTNSSSGTTPAPSTPAPAASTVAPAQQPAQTTTETRSRSGSSDDSTRRTSGSSRDKR